ncbi:MAG: toxin TcdB middle/N-terminal domain-containing protein, partial [Bacteroidales bacterium]|nr:toxin TcdB middle/N-terminal domain-containing protein [Bacteroidales bacterium]
FLVSYYKSKEGYGNLQRISKAIDEENGPRVIFSELQQTIFLADMCGDGLTDIVRIKNGSICYWPNLGYGKFGKKVQMKNAPRFDSSDMFDPSRLRMVDIDGSGTTDIIYLGVNETNYWKNLSGNSWSETILIPTFPKVGSLTNVSVFDIEGNGTSALVWSTPLPGKPERIKYIELTGGKKPFLLNQINNNMGATRSLFYTPSTKFYLQDKKAGKPWITKLGFPVHVVERIEVYDEPTNSKYVSRYAYHHGYFDGYEREFRGFGMVEQWDTDDFGTIGGSINPSEGDTYPMYTKTWFHTGFYKNADAISDLYKQEYFDAETNDWLLPDTILPEGLNIQEKREAARVLRGSALRQEIYSQDGSEKEGIPYSVTENSFKITIKQNLHKNKHAVFMVLPSESINLNYERVQADPRIVHTLNLEYDEFGNPKKQATVAYKRLTNAVSGQDKTLVSVKENSFFNSDENTGFHRIGVPYQTKNYEVFDFETSSSKLSIEDFSDYENLDKEIIQHQKTLFYDSTCENPLSLGSTSAHGLPYKSFTLAMTDALINAHVVADGRTNAPTSSELKTILSDAGYAPENNDTEYWMPSEYVEFDIQNFYLPVCKYDPLGNATEIVFDDYYLLPIQVIDALNNSSYLDNNYVAMQPYYLEDPNGNGIEMSIDGLGMVTKQALFGSQGEGDSISSPTVEYEYILDNWGRQVLDEEDNPVYDENGMPVKNKKPVFAYVRTKTVHGVYTVYFDTYEYSNGLGQPILIKASAEDGLAWQLNPTTGIKEEVQCNTRFVASGRIIYNNKGNVIKQYEPWFSCNELYVAEDELMEYGVTPIMHYDPAGRLIKTDFPDGTTSKVEFNAWEQKNYDQNDCDSSSPHYDTPQTVLISPLGVAFKTIDDNGTFGNVITTQNLNILGQVIEVEDTLERTMTQNVYDMAGQLIMTSNIDSGKRWIIYNAAKLPIYVWDSRDQRTIKTYDDLLRPVDTYLKVGTGSSKTVEIIQYGTNATLNNIGQVYLIKSQDGKTTHDLYDFKYNLLTLKKQFHAGYSGTTNWALTVLMQTTIYTVQTTYDALNRPVNITQPNNYVTTYVYNKGGLLVQVKRGSSYYISNIDYNARGQRTKVVYGNGSESTFTYDEENFRLIQLLTTRNTGNDILQDLNYSYDSVGNITQVEDDAQQTIYFNNTVIDPVSTYEYDALYRLVEATGRELTSLQMPADTDFVNNIPVPNTGSNAMQTYTQQYSYDALGNITQMYSVNQWTRDYIYDTATNRLLRHSGSTNVYTYDAHGNMLSMPHLTSMVWTYRDELMEASNGTVTSYYQYDAQGNRTRKVVVKPGNIREERYYIGGYEMFYKYVGTTTYTKRDTVHVSEERDRFVIIDVLYINNGITLLKPTTTTRYQYSNHLGSACLELDTSAAIISYEEYHPFGITSYRAGSSEAEVSLKRYKYVGKERDEETGLYYYGARYYAAWIGRWTSADPMKEKRIWVTPYNYCQNNPIVRIDPSGKLDDEWDLNIKTGEVTHVNTNGGVEEQTINFIDENGKTLRSETYEASGFDVTINEEGISVFASSFNNHQYEGSNTISLNYSADRMILPNSLESGFRYGYSNNTQYGFSDYLSDVNVAVGSFNLISGREYYFRNNGMWRGINNKWYGLNSGANQWTGSKIARVNKANSFKSMGRVFFYYGATLSTVDAIYNFSNGNNYAGCKNILDIGMSAFGTFGGFTGFVLSSIYFGMDAFGVFEPLPPGPGRIDLYKHEYQDKTYNVPTYRQKQFMYGSYNDYRMTRDIRNYFIDQ